MNFPALPHVASKLLQFMLLKGYRGLDVSTILKIQNYIRGPACSKNRNMSWSANEILVVKMEHLNGFECPPI